VRTNRLLVPALAALWFLGLGLLASCGDDDVDTGPVPDSTTTSTVDPSSTTSSLFIPTTSLPDPECEEIIPVDVLTRTLEIKPINGFASEGADGSLTCVYDFVEGTALEAAVITVVPGQAAFFVPNGEPGVTDTTPAGAVGELWTRTNEAEGSVRLFALIGEDLYEVSVVREGADPAKGGSDLLAVALANRLVNLKS